MTGNMFDKFFSGDLAALNKAEESIQGVKIEDPYIKGEDLDWNDPELVAELTGSELGADAAVLRRV